MKKEKGITLVALVVTIIILLILAGIGISSSTGINGNIQTAKTNIALAELSEVQQIVLETYIKYNQTKNEENIVGTALTYSEATSYASEVSSSISLLAEEYDLTSADITEVYYELSTSDLATLGIEEAEDTYIVNYSTGEVFNYTLKETADGQVLYVSK